jgi:hypothetical protein
MPTKPVTHSASRQLQSGTLRKRATLTLSKQPAPMRHTRPRQGSQPTLTRFNASTRKLLSRYAPDLQACIMTGQHLTEGDYGRIVRDLEALQAATAKVVTDLAIMAGEA